MKLEKYRYFVVALDPLHIGTGGYRLGRVDNTIVREPGTNLPKIPGTSLHGAIRHASAMRYGNPKSAGQNPKGEFEKDPVIYTFGAGEKGGFNAGVVNITDAKIFLFPMASQNEPIWITTNQILKEFGFNSEQPSECGNVVIASKLGSVKDKFPLGWLMMDIESHDVEIKPLAKNYNLPPSLKEAFERTVIVHEDVFSELVNSALEIRTSVAINPETGAAEPKALFTYESIPRATFLVFDVIVNDYHETGPWPVNNGKNRENLDWKGPKDVVKEGCQLLEYLGIGGMTTRGFGRIKVLKTFPQKVFEVNNK